VYQIGLLLIQQSHKLSPRVGRPKGFSGQLQAPEALIGVNFPVASAIRNHCVSGALQQFTLLLKDNILAARLLV
jgi:hypothetical protein